MMKSLFRGFERLEGHRILGVFGAIFNCPDIFNQLKLETETRGWRREYEEKMQSTGGPGLFTALNLSNWVSTRNN